MIWKGFRFGMILQLAVGPVCLFIFQTAVHTDFFTALIGVAGVTLTDALFILAAIWGLGMLLQGNRNTISAIRYVGAGVLILFGLSTILGSFGISFIPSLNLAHTGTSNVFFKTMLMTLSNPLTIVFWAGVFSTRVTEDDLSREQTYMFGFGAVLSTMSFLTAVSLLGDRVSIITDESMLSVLNIVVGILLIGYGSKSFYTAISKKAALPR